MSKKNGLIEKEPSHTVEVVEETNAPEAVTEESQVEDTAILDEAPATEEAPAPQVTNYPGVGTRAYRQ